MALKAGALPSDATGRPSSSGYAPGTGVLPPQLGTVTSDGSVGGLGQKSAPYVVQMGDGTTPSQTVAVDPSGAARVSLQAPATVVTSGNTAAVNTALNTTTLPAVSGKTNYITGFSVTTQGGTGAAAGVVTITGILGGTLNYQVGAAANAPINLNVNFHSPIPASAVNTAITVNVPQLGANTGAVASAIYGFVQ